MIIKRFLRWVRTASPRARTAASTALARAYLHCDLSPDDRDAVESAMIALLDDPSPLVRRALAEALAPSRDAPRAVVQALASDHRDIAAVVLARSPLLIDAELVDFVATCDSALQATIATRAPLRRAVAAAIAEVGSAEACLIAIENPCADVDPSSIAHIVDRFGHLGAIREALLARPDLPLAARQCLLRQLSGALVNFVVDRGWLARDRAEEAGREACEMATVTIAALRPDHVVQPLVRYLRASGQLTAGLMLRALLSGNIAMFESALAELAELPLRRVRTAIHGDRNGLRAISAKAGLAASAHVVFREVLAATGQAHPEPPPPRLAGEGNVGRLDRHMVERAIISCERSGIGDLDPLMIMLRRFATEAAREDARMNCERLLSEEAMEHGRAA
jgi:uncharacterized protein (DUF2336 family)